MHDDTYGPKILTRDLVFEAIKAMQKRAVATRAKADGGYGCNDCMFRTNECDLEYSNQDWPYCTEEMPVSNLKGFPFKKIPRPCLDVFQLPWHCSDMVELYNMEDEVDFIENPNNAILDRLFRELDGLCAPKDDTEFKALVMELIPFEGWPRNRKPARTKGEA